jgi:preprotein translocase subunit SecE
MNGEEMAVDVKGGIDKVRQFLREVKSELKKIAWPGRKETIASTVVVIVIVLIVCVYLGIVDVILSRLIKFIVY